MQVSVSKVPSVRLPVSIYSNSVSSIELQYSYNATGVTLKFCSISHCISVLEERCNANLQPEQYFGFYNKINDTTDGVILKL